MRVVGVLGLVDPAGVGIDGDGLVREPAERLDGLRVSVGVHVVGVDLEDEAVGLVNVLVGAGLLKISSQVSQVFHGVMPPAQFVLVPARLTYSRTRLPCASTSIVVVPPWTPGS